MICIYSGDNIFSEQLRTAISPNTAELFHDEARLAALIDKETPIAVIFDTRYETPPLRLMERIFYEHPDVIIIAIVTQNVHDVAGLSDKMLFWPVNPSEVALSLVEIENNRKSIAACGLIGRSESLAGAARIIMQVAPSDVNILITGPSGAGKEMVARAVLSQSKNPQSPFIAVNVAALAPGIIESELFGHEKGSFTGAASRRIGVFEQASGGIIFLDEIGEIPNDIQAKLLRVLEQRTFTRVGGNIPIKADFRLVAATNRDLAGDVAAGRFREDLYYRLRVVAVDLPALASRKADISPLTFHFLRNRSRELKIENLKIEPGALRLFHRYDWPGNVRELKNVIDSFAITSRSGHITAADFERYMLDNPSRSNYLPVITNRTPESAEHQLLFQAIMALTNEIVSLKKMITTEMERIHGAEPIASGPREHVGSVNVEDVERDLVVRALDKAHGNRKQAARLLGIGERTLYRKLEKYGLR